MNFDSISSLITILTPVGALLWYWKKRAQRFTQYERAQQLWSVLALAATNRQVMTYDIIRE